MAENREGPIPQEIHPDGLPGRVRERTRGVVDWFIDRNPVIKTQRDTLQRVHNALPEGRIKQATQLAVDWAKIPQAGMAAAVEIGKIHPLIRLALFIPEQILKGGIKMGGAITEKVIESAPVKFAVGTVEGVMDGILGKRAPAVEAPKATLDNAHQILVGMARPEMGKQERRKMG